jgi:dephospho-CoA kinase
MIGEGRKSMVFAVALTGDIGAGKSTLAHLWASMGALSISADDVVADLWKTHEHLRSAAKERWGSDLFDSQGILRKDLIAARAFGDTREYRHLCGMIHPLVEERIDHAHRECRGWFVAEIPLLFERGVPWWVDTTVYVAAPEEERLRRNAQRGKSREWLAMMESRLLPRKERLSLARVVLENHASREEFAEAAKALGKRFRAMASVVEMTWDCSSLEKIHKVRSILESRNLGAFFRLERPPFEKAPLSLSWLSLERHFPPIREILQKEEEEDRGYSLWGLRALSPRRMELEILEKIVEVCH